MLLHNIIHWTCVYYINYSYKNLHAHPPTAAFATAQEFNQSRFIPGPQKTTFQPTLHCYCSYAPWMHCHLFCDAHVKLFPHHVSSLHGTPSCKYSCSPIQLFGRVSGAWKAFLGKKNEQHWSNNESSCKRTDLGTKSIMAFQCDILWVWLHERTQ